MEYITFFFFMNKKVLFSFKSIKLAKDSFLEDFLRHLPNFPPKIDPTP